ncbi:carbon storage regulator [Marinobacterium weihaiense]|uniref:Carbon storage regulator n=1 Tax=Marinobacterium weihaiense TaxID=2851016 RepID=A0ABS6MEI3_9GAMM|nr:carbon storage regulator [Marinobacterium weihaiense]MBV0934142.1 carbon storage regulator [Marinobacterium weihaiense]
MLILTIKEGHCFHIGDDVVIQVEAHNYDRDDFSTGQMRNQVRLNIDAPKSVTVLREELYHSCSKSFSRPYRRYGS